jgi:ATP-dependent RNA helicase DeaD
MPKQFSDLNFSHIKSDYQLNIVVPTEIQEKAIPLILANTDLMWDLQKTGTGKTLLFGLPLYN